jgi:hypothetical protein
LEERINWFHVSFPFYQPYRMCIHHLSEVRWGAFDEEMGIPVDLKLEYHAPGSEFLFPWIIEEHILACYNEWEFARLVAPEEAWTVTVRFAWLNNTDEPFSFDGESLQVWLKGEEFPLQTKLVVERPLSADDVVRRYLPVLEDKKPPRTRRASGTRGRGSGAGGGRQQPPDSSDPEQEQGGISVDDAESSLSEEEDEDDDINRRRQAVPPNTLEEEEEDEEHSGSAGSDGRPSTPEGLDDDSDSSSHGGDVPPIPGSGGGPDVSPGSDVEMKSGDEPPPPRPASSAGSSGDRRRPMVSGVQIRSYRPALLSLAIKKGPEDGLGRCCHCDALTGGTLRMRVFDASEVNRSPVHVKCLPALYEISYLRSRCRMYGPGQLVGQSLWRELNEEERQEIRAIFDSPPEQLL